MTVDEYRQALERLTPEQFAQFKQGWGGAAGRSLEECVREFAYKDNPTGWDRTIVYHLKSLGLSDLQSEDERALAFAGRTAEAAALSADAAKGSASAAAASNRAAWLALVISLVAIVASLAIARC